MTNTSAQPTYTAIYAFGDSLSDAGNIWINTGTKPVSPPYFSQTYAVPGNPTVSASVYSNGPVWVQDLSTSLGLGVLAPSFAGGTDFAYAGSSTGPTPQNPGPQTHSLQNQVSDFQVAIPNPAATALYTISIGVNDILALIDNPALSNAAIRSGITAAVSNEMSTINQLVVGGAQHLLIVNIPDLGLFPTITQGISNGTNTPSAAFDAEATSSSQLYNQMLAAGVASVAANGVDIKIYDAFKFFDGAVATPSAYGFIDTSTPVWSGGFSDPNSGTLISPNPLVQDQYLFFDHEHPTETAQLAIASGAMAILSGGVQCFAEGTRISLRRGMVAIEHLRIGDMVRLAEGGEAPVIWLGHRRVNCRRHSRPWDVQPVRVLANAFGPGLPERDLLLSPDHAVCAGGGLIPVRYLINGASIVQEEAGEVTYWHVELPSHAVILAEGLACESYLDTGNRRGFTNGGPVIDLHPTLDPRIEAERIWAERGCAPLIRDGEALVAVRAELHRRLPELDFRETDDPELHLLANGVAVRPSMVNGGMHRFTLPAGTTGVTVCSISGVPAEHDPASIDRRRLGVMITAMTLRAPGRRLDLSHEATGSGFHPPEQLGAQQWQWTDGAGEIVLPVGFAATPCLLDLHIAAVRQGWRRQQTAMRLASAGRRDQPARHA